nr:hypothetical protein Iba_chr04bCG17380 [Ipomoea batatas]
MNSPAFLSTSLPSSKSSTRSSSSLLALIVLTDFPLNKTLRRGEGDGFTRESKGPILLPMSEEPSFDILDNIFIEPQHPFLPDDHAFRYLAVRERQIRRENVLLEKTTWNWFSEGVGCQNDQDLIYSCSDSPIECEGDWEFLLKIPSFPRSLAAVLERERTRVCLLPGEEVLELLREDGLLVSATLDLKLLTGNPKGLLSTNERETIAHGNADEHEVQELPELGKDALSDKVGSLGREEWDNYKNKNDNQRFAQEV